MKKANPKKIQQELQRLSDLAYERNLDMELSKLEQEFQRWKQKEISGFDLSEKIHRFHQGPAKELFLQYQGSSLNPIRVAQALIDNIISASEISTETKATIARQIQFLKED